MLTKSSIKRKGTCADPFQRVLYRFYIIIISLLMMHEPEPAAFMFVCKTFSKKALR